MAYKTGKSKSPDNITLDDILQHPIWEYALDEEGIEEQDESWLRPVVDTDNVVDEIDSPVIALKIKESNIYACGEYDVEMESIVGIAIWDDNEWLPLSDADVSTPLTFTSIPKIEGVENVEFICTDIEDEEAFKHSEII